MLREQSITFGGNTNSRLQICLDTFKTFRLGGLVDGTYDARINDLDHPYALQRKERDFLGLFVSDTHVQLVEQFGSQFLWNSQRERIDYIIDA
jgi:hypothetical protein